MLGPIQVRGSWVYLQNHHVCFVPSRQLLCENRLKLVTNNLPNWIYFIRSSYPFRMAAKKTNQSFLWPQKITQWKHIAPKITYCLTWKESTKQVGKCHIDHLCHFTKNKRHNDDGHLLFYQKLFFVVQTTTRMIWLLSDWKTFPLVVFKGRPWPHWWVFWW